MNNENEIDSTNEQVPIFPAASAIESFRDGGYKNTANAVAEIVDNSIDADAKDIRIFTISTKQKAGQRMKMKVDQIGVLDNGSGMSKKELDSCLGFGVSGRDINENKIGRFGVGMTQSSISQCKRIEVYTWQAKEKTFFNYLDIDEIKEKDTQFLPKAIEKDIPENIKNIYKGDMGESGTLVIWQKCDRLDIAVSDALYRRMNKHLCRVYRHFLDDDDFLGDRRNINFDQIQESKIIESLPLRANDPLYLLTPNNCPGFENESSNIPFSLEGGLGKLEVELENGDISVVEFIASVAKPEVQASGDQMKKGARTAGSTAYGIHYGNNVGVSFVRAGREIILDDKGFFDAKITTQRWWGCEVRFDPILDEYFGVTNNKQDVTKIDFLNPGDFANTQEDSEDGDLKATFRIEFQRNIQDVLRELKRVVDKRSTGIRTDPKASTPTVPELVNDDLDGDQEETFSGQESSGKDEQTILDEKIKAFMLENSDLSEEDAKKIAQKEKNFVVDITKDYWAGSTFIDLVIIGKAATLKINTGHPFFSEFYQPLEEMEDQKPLKALQAILLGYARAEDKSRFVQDKETFEILREDWGMAIRRWIVHSKN